MFVLAPCADARNQYILSSAKKKKRNNVHKNESHKIFLTQDGSHFGTINYEHLPRDTRVLD